MPQNPDDHEDSKKQDYVVKTEFTDAAGKTWTVGSAFEGDEEAVRRLLAAGKIAARPQPEPQT